MENQKKREGVERCGCGPWMINKDKLQVRIMIDLKFGAIIS